MKELSHFLQDESGATAIEYGLIAVLIVTGLIAAMIAMGQYLAGTYNSVADGMNASR